MIGGVTQGISDIVVMPPATLASDNGYPSIICSYSCDITTEQGGCNTVDQVADYFLDAWGGTLLFHLTQYGCWGGVYDIGDGGNCCVGGIDLDVLDRPGSKPWTIHPVPADDVLYTDAPGVYEVLDLQGRFVERVTVPDHVIPLGHLAPGAYQLRSVAQGDSRRFLVNR